MPLQDTDPTPSFGGFGLTLSPYEYACNVVLGSPSTATVTIIDDEEPNNPPVIATTSPITVKENQTAVATLEATDSDNDSLTGWSITGGADLTLFNLTNGGVLTFVTAPDYENPTDDGSDNGYEVEVTASDGTDDSTPKTITVNVTDVDEPPGAPTDLSVSTNDDNPSTALDVSWTAPDADGIPPITGYDIQYRKHSEIDWTNHNFDPVGTTTMTTVPNLDSNTTYQVQVRATNDEGKGQWATSSGTTEKANLTVAFISATYTLNEGDTATSTVTVTPTTDRDVTVTITMTGAGATLSGLTNGNALTIARGQNSASFTISGDQDNDATDGEVVLTLSTDDDGVSVGSPSTTTITIIDDEEPNNPPVITATSTLTVQENQTTVATLEAKDSDNDPISRWSITGGADRTVFNLTNSGELSFKTAPDYENPTDSGTDNTYQVEVIASDGKDDSAPMTITVNVTDVDEAPGPPNSLSVSTNQDNPTTALEVSWTAPDTTGIPPITGYDIQYRKHSEIDWTNHNFDPVGTTTMTTVPNLDSNTTYQVQVRATNDEGKGQWAASSGTTGKANLTVTFSAATYTLNEGDTATSTVNVTPTADRDITVTITMTGTGATLYGLNNGNALTIARGQNSASFTISGDQDEDAIDSEVTLTLSTDADGVSLGSPTATTVTIEEPNSPPVITTTSPITVKENQTAVATLEATDSDNDPITGWSITGGADRALFSLTNDGELSFRKASDYENPTDSGTDNTYQVEVTASDGTDDSDPLTLTVNVTDLNEPPTFSEGTITTRTVAENSPESTQVGSITADDPEDDALVYELSGTGHENFTVDANGQITVATNAVLDFETLPTYTLDLHVSDAKDADGNSNSEVDDTITITINLTDVPPPPQMELPAFSAAGTADTTSMLILKWVAPTLLEGTPSITGYEVQYREQEETNWIVHNFESDGSTSETTITGLASNTYYDAQVRAVNVEGPGLWSPTSSAKTTEAALTVAFSSATYTVDEGEEATITVTVTPTADRDVTVTITMTGAGATLSGLTNEMLTIERGENSDSFTISADQDNDATDGEVVLTLSTNADGVSVGNPSTTTVTIIDDEVPNSPPTFATTTVNRIIPENSPVGTLLGDPIAATDPEDDSLTYSLSGDGSEHFNVNNQGQITLRASLNHEDAPSYTLILSVSDGKDDISNPDSETDATVTANVTVEDINEPPGAPGDLSVSTNEDNPTSALDVNWNTPDTTGIPNVTGYDVEYRAGDSGMWTAHEFESDDNTTETTIPDLASNTTYQVQARAKNNEGEGQWAASSGVTEKARLTIAFSAATYTVDEGEEATITVIVTPTADRSVTVTVTMSGTGATLSGLGTGDSLTIARGQNSASLTISGDEDNNATDGEVTLTLSTDDDGVTLGSPSTTTVTIEEPNNPPVITTTSPITVKENQTAIATLEATDSDDDPITGWSITGGADSALFDLTTNGVLTFNTAPDYENPRDVGRDNSYEVEVTASDGTDDSDPLTLTVNVTNVNEPPTFSEGISTTRTIAENSPGDTQVGDAFTADDPEDDTLAYNLSGTGHENFTVDANGQITVATNAVLDFETQPTYSLELHVSDAKDADGNTDSEVDHTITITINLTDVQPPPQMELPAFSAAGTADTTSMLILKWVAPTLLEGTPSITGYEVQYRVQGDTDWIDHDFDSDGSTIEMTISGLASNTYYDAQIRAVNIEGPGDWSPTSSATTTEAALTVAFGAATLSVDEGDTATSTVTVNPTADRDVTVTVTISGEGAMLSGLDTDNTLTIPREQRSASSASFTVFGEQDDDAANDEVTLTLSTDDDGVSVGNPSTTTITVIDDEIPNFPPAFATTTVNRIIPEDSPVETHLGEPITATDPEGDSLTYSLSGEYSQHFNVNNQGQITLSANLDHEVTPSYTLTLSVRDSKDGIGNPNSETDASITVNVTVGDIDEPPGSVEPVMVTSLSKCINHPSRAAVSVEPVMVASLSSSELLACWSIAPNTGPDVEYQAQYRERGQDDWVKLDLNPDSDSDFDDATETRIRNLDSNTTYQVQVRAFNDEGESEWAEGVGTTERAQLTVAFSSETYMVNEGEEATITVTVTPTADRDVTVTVEITDGTGATLSGLDTGNTLTIAREMNSTSFTISADQDVDTEDGLVTLALTTDDDKVTLNPSSTTVSINDDDTANNLPTFNDSDPAERSVSENSDAGTPVGAAVSAIDEDEDDALIYSAIDASGQFRIDSGTGQIRVNVDDSLNYEEQNTYSSTVSVTDGKATVGITVNILVTDVDGEAPGQPDPPLISANAATALDVKWGRPVNTGPTITHYEVQYGVSPVQNESSWASVDPPPTATQTIIHDLNSNTAYDVRVRAVNDDGASPWSNSDTGSTSPAQLTVAFSAPTYTMNEGHEAIITVTVAPTADRDVTVTVTLSGEGATLLGLDVGNTLDITRGQNSASFTISSEQDDDAVDGLVTLALTTDDDKVTLNPSTATVSINDDDSSLPTFNDLDPAERLVPENSDAGTPVGAAVSATDADQNDTLTYSIIDTSGKFRIDNSTGEIRVNIDNSLNYEEQDTYLTTVSVTDGKATVGLTVNILVSNINEPPDAPGNLSVSTNDDSPTTALDVSWFAPDATGIPAISSYDVQYRTRGSSHWKDHDFDSEGSTTKTTITGLAPNTTHQVQVRGTTRVKANGPQCLPPLRPRNRLTHRRSSPLLRHSPYKRTRRQSSP